MTDSAVTIALAYLMGAFPTAYLLGRLKGIDIFRLGSQNPGALNVYHQLGTEAGLLVLVVDTGKGALANFIGQRLGASDAALYAARADGYSWAQLLAVP